VPPALTSKQMFLTGLVLTALGIVLSIFGVTVMTVLIQSTDAAAGTAAVIVSVLAQIVLTLGVVLLAVSPLARMIEAPPKRPEAHTVLLREGLDKRTRRKELP